MENSKLISILRCLSSKQIKQFADFVRSPYFNKKEEVAKLYETISRYYPQFDAAAVDKERIFAATFPHTPYDEKELGYWMSDLVKLLEQFIVVEETFQQPAEQFPHLFKFYLRWNLEKPFLKTLRDATAYLESLSRQDTEYYYNELIIKEQEMAFFDKQKKHTHHQSLTEAVESLDIYYLTRKLQYSCEMLNRQNMLSSEYELKMVEEILQYLDKAPHNHVPPVAIYRSILLCLMQPNVEQHYANLKFLLNEYSHKFLPEEARNMYLYAINYCVNKINRGNPSYNAELFELYQTLIHNRIIFEGKHLSPWTYRNIVVLGIKNEAYEWTETFIHQYHPDLAKQFRENAYNYNLAYLYFSRKQYAKAQKLLSEVVFDDVFYNIESKSLLMRLFYEEKETEPLLALCEAFKIFLKRNKLIADNKREIYLNFIKYVSKLVKIPKGRKDQLQELLQQIANNRQMVNTEWLKQKIEEKLRNHW